MRRVRFVRLAAVLPMAVWGRPDGAEGEVCPMHDFRSRERERIRERLGQTSLMDVARFERARGGLQLGSCSASPKGGGDG